MTIEERTARVAGWNRLLVALARDPALEAGDLAAMLARITEVAAEALGVARASVWLYDDARTAIRCLDLFERTTGAHSAGVVLAAVDFPGYFQALTADRTIPATDAHTDPRTREFSEPYLRPLGIGAMLDIPIRRAGRMIGVLCHEHVGGARPWTLDEELFAGSVGDFVTMALEAKERARAEDARRKAEAEASRMASELAIARRLQTSLVPADPTAPGLDVAASMLTATEVGGDYYDVVPHEGGAYVGIGDVAGHGLPAGIVMLMVQSAVAALVRTAPHAPPSVLVGQLAAVVHDGVKNRLRQAEHVTLTLLRWDAARRTLVHAGAHEDILVFRAGARAVERHPTHGTWLGLTPDVSAALRDTEVTLAPGDVVLLHTDGITETRGEGGALFELEGLERAFAVAAREGGGAAAIRDRLLAATAAAGTADDDQTLLVLVVL